MLNCSVLFNNGFVDVREAEHVSEVIWSEVDAALLTRKGAST